MNKREIAETMRRIEAEQERLIRERGWALVGVFDPDGETTPFTYTIGLAAHGGAEYLMAGIDPRQAGGVLNGLGDKLAHGWRPQGEVVDEVLGGGYRVRLVEMTDENEAHQARNWWADRGEAPVRIVQLVFPDPAGHLPGEPDCQPVFVTRQRVPGSAF